MDAAAEQEGVDTEQARVFVHGKKGYVWDADEARTLREKHRLVGVMVGGVAKYKQQDDLRGLPLELCLEEVTLAVQRGWAVTCGMPGGALPGGVGTGSVEALLAELAPKTSERVGVPLLRDGATASDTSLWTAPSTPEERLRCAVFADLHRKGHWLTSGAKFGADFLAYPGDPLLYHAQLTVRILDGDAPMPPLTLAAAGRSSHAARKHLLLCSVEDSSEPDWQRLCVRYVCVTPEQGFGRAV